MPSVLLQRCTIRVFRFSAYDIARDEFVMSQRWATSAFIQRLGARTEGSGVSIDNAVVDADGLTPRGYRPSEQRRVAPSEVPSERRVA